MKDLLGDEIETSDAIKNYLQQIDAETLKLRSRNLSFITSIAPDCAFMMPPESFHVFTEARDAFVNGLYVATLLLAQAFIEHRLQIFMNQIGENEVADKGLGAIVTRLQGVRPDHRYIWDKINGLRLFRNPFTHLKPFEHPHTVSQVSLSMRMHPNDVLYHKAKEAVSLMYTVAIMNLR